MLLDIPCVSDQLSFISRIIPAQAEWAAVNVQLKNHPPGSVIFLGRRLESALAGKDAAIFVKGADRLLVFARKADFKAPIADALVELLKTAQPDLACDAQEEPLTEAFLQKLEEGLTQARDRKLGPPLRSSLFGHRSSRKSNVTMVVDDDAFLCETMVGALKRFGECHALQEPAQVLDTYLKKNPDCLFLDLHLPDQSGLELIDDIMKYDSDAYIIMLTADNKASQAIAAKKGGAKSFITKPVAFSRVEYELFRCPTFRRYGG